MFGIPGDWGQLGGGVCPPLAPGAVAVAVLCPCAAVVLLLTIKRGGGGGGHRSVPAHTTAA